MGLLQRIERLEKAMRLMFGEDVLISGVVKVDTRDSIFTLLTDLRRDVDRLSLQIENASGEEICEDDETDEADEFVITYVNAATGQRFYYTNKISLPYNERWTENLNEAYIASSLNEGANEILRNMPNRAPDLQSDPPEVCPVDEDMRRGIDGSEEDGDDTEEDDCWIIQAKWTGSPGTKSNPTYRWYTGKRGAHLWSATQSHAKRFNVKEVADRVIRGFYWTDRGLKIGTKFYGSVKAVRCECDD